MRSVPWLACALVLSGAARASSSPEQTASSTVTTGTLTDDAEVSAGTEQPKGPEIAPSGPTAEAPPPKVEPAAITTQAPPPKVEPASTMTELPAIGNDPAVRVALRGMPASLPPVTAQIFHIGGRTEAEPLFQISVGDPFFRSWLVGVRVEHHLDERWSVGIHALGGASSISAPIELCGGTACDAPAAATLRSTPGNLEMMAGLEMGWSPLYGKLSLFGEKTIHFDAYLALGPEVVRERIAPDASSPESGRFAMGGRASIGERVFFSDNFMIRFGVSEVVYGSSVRGSTELERKLSLEGGVAWLFGASR
jgi:outer membrane beta-barrel protein